jgi:putative salt-induced outer membrane protein YdiY
MTRLAAIAAALLPLATLAEAPAPAGAAAPAEAAKPVEAAKPAEPPRAAAWKGTVGAGLIVLTGNSESTTFSGSATASRERAGWIVSAKASGAYGRSRSPTDGTKGTTADGGAFQLRLDRKFGQGWTVYALGGFEFDHVASVESRSLAEVGGSAQWLDVKEGDWQRLALRTDLGVRYAYETRFGYFGATTGPLPAVQYVAPRLGLAFRWSFSREVSFSEEAELLPTISDSGRVLVKSVSKLSSHLTRAISLGVGYTVTHDSRPADDKVKTDTSLTAVLEVGF